jgi:hypothetical protein
MMCDNASLDSRHSESTTGTGINWLLDTFSSQYNSQGGSISIATKDNRHDANISLEALDYPGCVPSVTSGLVNDVFKIPRKNTIKYYQELSPMQKALLTSPYTKHRRVKAFQKKKLTKQIEDNVIMETDTKVESPHATTSSSKKSPNKYNDPGIIKQFFHINPAEWSSAPSTSGIFDDIRKSTASDRMVDKITKRAVATALAKNRDSITNLSIELEQSIISAKKTQSPDNKILSNDSIDITSNAMNKSASAPVVTIKGLNNGGSLDTSIFNDSQVFNKNSDDFFLKTQSEDDPLYRIMCEENERVAYISRLNQNIDTSRPLASSPNARKTLQVIESLSSTMIKPHECKQASGFQVLPSQLWPTAKIVYFFIAYYYDLILKGRVNMSLTLTSNKVGTEAEKDDLTEDSGQMEVNDENIFDATYISKVANVDVIKYLDDVVDIQNFWHDFGMQSSDDGVELSNINQVFNWRWLKLLLACPFECSYVLYCIESGGVNDSNKVNVDDFYTLFPESLLIGLQDMASPQTFHPAYLSSISLPFARLCSWARRIVVGIYTVKIANMRVPLPISNDNILLHPMSSALEGGNKAGNGDNDSIANVTYITASATTSGSLLNYLNVNEATPQQRVEHLITYRPVATVDSTIVNMKNNVNFVVHVDGSEISQAAFITAMSLVRPFDRITVIVNRKPVDVRYPMAMAASDVALDTLKSHYDKMTSCFSNSPVHRVALATTLKEEIVMSGKAFDKLAQSKSLMNTNNDAEPVVQYDLSKGVVVVPDNVQSISIAFTSNNGMKKEEVNTKEDNTHLPAIENGSNTTEIPSSSVIADLLDYSFRHHVDFCTVAYGCGRHEQYSSQALHDSYKKHVQKPFSVIVGSPNISNRLNTYSMKNPGLLFLPSRFVVCIKNDAESKAAFLLTRKLARPCDLIFLIHLSINTVSNTNSSEIANNLVTEYRNLGHNLHVEPVSIPVMVPKEEMMRIVAAQLRRTAEVFEPSFVVLGANYQDIEYICCGSGKSVSHSSNAKASVLRASYLEDDEFENQRMLPGSGFNSLTQGILDIDNDNPNTFPFYSYILVSVPAKET